MKQVKFTDGCPNGCGYCYEPKVQSKYYDPEIPQGEDFVQILDMNLLSNPKYEEIIVNLMEANNTVYELVCGVDYRRLNQEICNMLYNARFKKIRWTWDYSFGLQKVHKDVLRMLLNAGYKAKELSIFMLCDWKITYEECLRKLDLLKIWNVKVNDCWFDGVVSPNFQCNYWTLEQCQDFRRRCRKHNQMVLFKIDPELK